MQKHRAKKTGGWTYRAGWLLMLAVSWAGGVLPLRAHDLWLEPGAPLAVRGDELTLHLLFGDAFTSTEERSMQKDHVARFDLFSDRTRRRDLMVAGHDEQSPVAKVHLESGAALAVMDRPAWSITMPAEKFNRYLADEGLDAITAQRAKMGQTDQPGREIYARYLKTLIQEKDLTAAVPNTFYRRRVGQRLEILLETDPSRARPDGTLSVKVLFEGEPLAGARVFAYRRAVGNAPQTATTSARGLADFKVDQPGLWLVRLVHMRAATDKQRSDNPGQWESFWAAYTFAVRYSQN